MQQCGPLFLFLHPDPPFLSLLKKNVMAERFFKFMDQVFLLLLVLEGEEA
jgi:hypothetical protein